MAWIVLDTETTGLAGRPYTCIVEVGAVALDDNFNELGCFSSLVRPTKPWHDDMGRAFETHGLDWKTLQTAPESAQVWQALLTWAVCAVPPPVYITSYHTKFDAQVCKDQGWNAAWVTLCIMDKFRELAKARGWLNARGAGFRLVDAVERLGIQHGAAHRALDDARAAAAVLKHMAELPDVV